MNQTNETLTARVEELTLIIRTLSSTTLVEDNVVEICDNYPVLQSDLATKVTYAELKEQDFLLAEMEAVRYSDQNELERLQGVQV